MAVGTKSELEKLKLLVGEEASEESMMDSGGVVARDVMVSNREVTGRTLRALRLNSVHKVVVSRVFRENLTFTPDADFIVEVGDMVRVIGDKDDVEEFVTFAGQQEKRVHETNIAVLALGISLGVLLAYYEFTLPGGIHFRLGLAGGPLFVSLILAHFGRIGRLNVRTPRGAKHFMQQLGLVLFFSRSRGFRRRLPDQCGTGIRVADPCGSHGHHSFFLPGRAPVGKVSFQAELPVRPGLNNRGHDKHPGSRGYQ